MIWIWSWYLLVPSCFSTLATSLFCAGEPGLHYAPPALRFFSRMLWGCAMQTPLWGSPSFVLCKILYYFLYFLAFLMSHLFPFFFYTIWLICLWLGLVWLLHRLNCPVDLVRSAVTPFLSLTPRCLAVSCDHRGHVMRCGDACHVLITVMSDITALCTAHAPTSLYNPRWHTCSMRMLPNGVLCETNAAFSPLRY